jgi:sterol desaturase/sphingolipid hydroxylase (fatty acid hydroxylase superfamily)
MIGLPVRIISTPSTHSGHHGLRKDNPATIYKGNYGNIFVLFGTAKITRQYPQSYGVEGMQRAEWAEQLFWPLVKNKKPSLAKKNASVER